MAGGRSAIIIGGCGGTAALASRPIGYSGRIVAVSAEDCPSSLPPAELERRLLEMGFVEGARVEILHQGLFGADPIAIRVDGATVALRRREALAILTEPMAAAGSGVTESLAEPVSA